MRYSKILTALVVVAAPLAVLHGESDAQTAAVAGTYTLAAVNGEPLPFLTETEDSCREEAISGTLTLESDGDWELRYVERETCGAEVQNEDEGGSGDYTVAGQTVRFSDETEELDPSDLDLEELGVGTVNGAELRVTLRDQRTVLTFRRQ